MTVNGKVNLMREKVARPKGVYCGTRCGEKRSGSTLTTFAHDKVDCKYFESTSREYWKIPPFVREGCQSRLPSLLAVRPANTSYRISMAWC